jgi:hypothetical protein
LASRVVYGANQSWINSSVRPVPLWIKLERIGNTFTGYACADGINWITVGAKTIEMGNTIYIGMANCSIKAATLTKPVFDNVTAPCAAPTVTTTVPFQTRPDWAGRLLLEQPVIILKGPVLLEVHILLLVR